MTDAWPGRLLVLDDDEAVCATVGVMGTRAGFDTQTTTDADAFFEILTAWNPTHVAVDLMMPDVDGIEVINRLSVMRAAVAVIVMSALGERVLDAAQRAANEHGLHVAGVLPRPFSSEKLRTLLMQPIPATTAKAKGDPPPKRLEPRELSENDLLAAIERRQFCVHYQPKISCKTGALAGFEGLVRWAHPDLGLVMPDLFIPLAERAGLIDRMTDQIFDQALGWFASTFPKSDLLLSLNLSARSLDDKEIVNRIAKMCDTHAVAPSCIIVELTETSAMSDPTATLDLATRFRIKGFALSIDDFGVGYSSLVQLSRLPFSELKIDKSFVIDASRSEETRSIIKMSIGLAKQLGMRVTAEGVEDQVALDFLRDAGCDLAQGYFIGRPMPAESIQTWILSRRFGA